MEIQFTSENGMVFILKPSIELLNALKIGLEADPIDSYTIPYQNVNLTPLRGSEVISTHTGNVNLSQVRMLSMRSALLECLEPVCEDTPSKWWGFTNGVRDKVDPTESLTVKDIQKLFQFIGNGNMEGKDNADTE